MRNLYKKGIFTLSLMLGLSAQAQFPAPYCEVTFSEDVEPITLVNFAGINNTSAAALGGPEHEDFTAITGTVTVGETYDITVNGNTGGAWTNYFRVFVDWNQNGDFDDDVYYDLGSLFANDGFGTPLESTIQVPIDALTGTTRMRVIKLYDQYPGTSCVEGDFGQAEDYSLTVVGPPDCTGTPTVGAVTPSVADACPGVPLRLEVDTDFAAALSFQWEVSQDGGATWANFGDPQSYPFYSVFQTEPSTYRVTVTCIASGESVVSSTVTVGQNTVEDCYCTEGFELDCTDNDAILNVSFGSIANPSACGDALTGYSDYTATVAPATVDAGSVVPMSVTVGDGWSFEAVGVWIDSDANGYFSEDEFTSLGVGTNEVLTEDIVIPANAVSGTTRMRVAVFAVGAAQWTWTCPDDANAVGYGEIEDYAVVINNLSAPSFNASQLSVYPNPTNGIVNLQFAQATDINSVSVYSVSGRLVHSQNFSNVSDNYQMNLQNLAEGIYMVKVETPQGSITKKLIKN